MRLRSHENEELFRAARRAGREGLRAFAQHDGDAGVNRPLVRELGASGLLARLFPSSTNGHSGQMTSSGLCALREGLAMECTQAETALALQGLGGYPILQHGHEDLIERWIPGITAGELVVAFALSEPDAGSDAASLSLSAEPCGDGFRLHGTKKWISNAPDADVYTVFARTSDERHGVSAFVVSGDSVGLSGRALRMLSPHAIGELHFDGVEVGPEAMLGKPGDGFRVAMRTLDLFRPSVGAFAVGMAQSALDLTVDYVSQRHAFGKTLAEQQVIAHRIADITARVTAARLLVYRAAEAHDSQASDKTQLAAMAKLVATEIAQEAVDVAVQFHGAAGLEVGHPLEHLYREVRAPRIYEGASEIQREIIARGLFQSSQEAIETVTT